jgi:glutamate N-acetyltransferase / amino-acid N-acetyltransferase
MAVGSGCSGEFFPVAGIRLAAVKSEIRYQDRLDLVLIELAENASVAGVYTQNAFCAAPVSVTKAHTQNSFPRYFLINTGNANAGTGEVGKVNALRCCQAIADLAGASVQQVLPFSTGVIGEELPVEKILVAAPDAYTSLSETSWAEAAEGILTTDTRPKLLSTQVEVSGKKITITGIAKGSGMIKPNMATMLSFVFTDADVEAELLDELLRGAVAKSFNRITVDGDTSTNDCCMLVATGKADVSIGELGADARGQFVEALESLFTSLATELIKDAEGASKFLTVTVAGGASLMECQQIAYCIAESPLVKTAMFAADPNWGRILAAVGRSGIDNLDLESITIDLGSVRIVSDGGVDPGYSEELGQAVMDQEEIVIFVNLNRGNCTESVWTSDLSHDYVSINADYRT